RPLAAPMVTNPTFLPFAIALIPLEGRVERDLRRREIGPPHVAQRVGRAPFAVHARVLPFNRERALVTDAVQRPDEGLEVDVSVPRRYERPAALDLSEVDVGAEDRAPAVEHLFRVLDVHVVDAITELHDELRRVEELMREMARIEVDAEAGPAPDRIQRLSGRDEVVRDLGRVHFEPEPDAFLVEDVDDRIPALGELCVPALDLG